MSKVPNGVKEFLTSIGRKGGLTRAKRHSDDQLSEWGRMGGNPGTTQVLVLGALKRGPKTVSELHEATQVKVSRIRSCLARLSRLKQIKNVGRGKWEIIHAKASNRKNG